MIIESIINIFTGITGFLLNLIPTITSPTAFFASALSTSSTITSSVGFFIPLDIVGVCVTLILGVYTFEYTLALIRFIFALTPYKLS